VGLARNGQSAEECRDRCEQKAKDRLLYWEEKIEANRFGLPTDLPSFDVNDNGLMIVPPVTFRPPPNAA
jgi:hypothetical protein